MSRTALLFACLLLTPAAASAQLQTPSDWKWSLDEPAELSDGEGMNAGEWWFVAMPPGWHITMGPGGVVYQPAIEGWGQFVLESELFLFPNSTNDGVGLFLGGRELEGQGKTYTAFEIRRDGSAAVIRRGPAGTSELAAWKRQDAIPPHAGKDPEKHTLRLEVGTEQVVFLVDGARVATLARQDVGPDGLLGFRIGKGVNIHVVRLDVTFQLAPPRQPAASGQTGNSAERSLHHAPAGASGAL